LAHRPGPFSSVSVVCANSTPRKQGERPTSGEPCGLCACDRQQSLAPWAGLRGCSKYPLARTGDRETRAVLDLPTFAAQPPLTAREPSAWGTARSPLRRSGDVWRGFARRERRGSSGPFLRASTGVASSTKNGPCSLAERQSCTRSRPCPGPSTARAAVAVIFIYFWLSLRLLKVPPTFLLLHAIVATPTTEDYRPSASVRDQVALAGGARRDGRAPLGRAGGGRPRLGVPRGGVWRGRVIWWQRDRLETIPGMGKR
jgi:hypothetical protein